MTCSVSTYVSTSGCWCATNYYYNQPLSRQVGGELFRVTTLNCRYGVVPSYPALMLVPARISDDSLRRYARYLQRQPVLVPKTWSFLARIWIDLDLSILRYHKHSRFPTVTWRHPRSHALLLRGSGFQQRGVMGMIKRHHQPQHQQEAGGGHGGGAGGSGGGGQAEVASSIEAEMYTAAVIQVRAVLASRQMVVIGSLSAYQVTPRSTLKTESAWKMSGSELSINSLVAGSAGAGAGGSDYSAVHTYPTLTPNTARKFNPLAKAMGTLTRNTAAPSSSSSSGAAGKLSRLSLTGKGGKLYGSQVRVRRHLNANFAFKYWKTELQYTSKLQHLYTIVNVLALLGKIWQWQKVKLGHWEASVAHRIYIG